MSSTIWRERFVRSSYIVSTTPSIPSPGLNDAFTRSIVSIRSVTPSSAKYSHWIGMRTVSAAQRLLSVNSPRDGGQSIRMKSNSPDSGERAQASRRSRSGRSTSSISAPTRSRVEETRERFGNAVLLMAEWPASPRRRS